MSAAERVFERAWLTLVLAVALAIGGCDKSSASHDNDTSAPAVADSGTSSDSRADVVGDTACAPVGNWTECKLLERLENAGLAPRRAQGSIRQPFLSIPGFVIAVGEAELQAYVYSDTLALKRDYERLDTVRVAPPTMQVTWRATPHLVRSNNLLAILLSNDEAQVERVRNAIEAGLPVAPSRDGG